jgi:hypothetical protein
MAGSTSKYRLMLETVLDASKIQSQIDALEKKYNFNLNVNINAQGAQQAQAAVAGIQQQVNQVKQTAGNIPVNIGVGNSKDVLDALEKKMAEINSKANRGIASYGISTSIGETGEEVVSATIKYEDALGRAVTDKYKLVELETMQNGAIQKSLEFTQTGSHYTDNEIARQKALTAELEKANTQADKFLQKSKIMGGADVTKGKDIAQQLKVAVSTGDIDNVRKLSTELNVLNSSLRTGGFSIRNWITGLGDAMKITVEFAMTSRLINGAMEAIGNGVQYIKDLDKAMTDVRVVTGMTKDEANSLAKTYNNLAKELGSTTLEIAQGSLEWSRQGKTIEETAQMMKATMMLSKLGNMDSAQATEYLTSTLNGFKLEAKDAVSVVDKLIAVEFAATYSNIWSGYTR